MRALAQVCRRTTAGVCATATCGDPACITAAAGSVVLLPGWLVRKVKGGAEWRWGDDRAVAVSDRLLLRNKAGCSSAAAAYRANPL